MLTIWEKIQAAHLTGLIPQTLVAVERESHRIDDHGVLAVTDHPKALGNRATHPYFQTDFAESQLEIITSPNVLAQTVDELQALTASALRGLPQTEALWPLTMPATLPHDVPIAHPTPERLAYREQLVAKTKAVNPQLMSSIHLNLSLPEQLFERLYEAENFKGTPPSYLDYRNQIYLHLAQQWIKYRFVLTYLFGASPAANPDFNSALPKQPVRSLHSSHQFGYHNDEHVHVSYSSVEAYASDLKQAVESGQLISPAQLYAEVRLRSSVPLAQGIHYLEFRDLDLNPFVATGIDAQELQFMQDFAWFLLSQPQMTGDIDAQLAAAARMNDKIAMQLPTTSSQAVADVMDQMAIWLNQQTITKPQFAAFTAMQDRVLHPEHTPAAKLVAAGAFETVGQQLARTNKQWATDEPYLLPGFTDMEQSTQMLIEDAMRIGLKVDVLDRSDQFIRLTNGEHQELVRAGNETRLDNLVASRLVDNKFVTKQLLGEAGLPVARAMVYHDLESAQRDFATSFRNKSLVIKPNAANVGEGVSLFMVPPTPEEFETAFQFAHRYGDVLVELFVRGTEYRFFVVANHVHAILERVPANVVGDGQHTVAELVAKKNQDPMRGEAHRKPLQQLHLDERELAVLAEQGLTADSVVPRGHQAFLLTNSNISTGGDSYDMTDEVDESYKKLAVKVAKTMGQTISGVDMIIPNLYQPYQADQAGMATVIEANYNPAMFMHLFPYSGKPRRVTRAVLAALFPEMKDL